MCCIVVEWPGMVKRANALTCLPHEMEQDKERQGDDDDRDRSRNPALCAMPFATFLLTTILHAFHLYLSTPLRWTGRTFARAGALRRAPATMCSLCSPSLSSLSNLAAWQMA